MYIEIAKEKFNKLRKEYKAFRMNSNEEIQQNINFLENGKDFMLLNEDTLGDETKVSITYKELS